MSGFVLPRRGRGRPSAVKEARYQADLAAFCELILKIRATMDFAIGARGWCYTLEPYGLNKGDFDAAQSLISDCRKAGDLPFDIVAEDAAREFINVESVDLHTIEEEAENVLNYVEAAHKYYKPVSFWDFQDFYVEMLVEKIDLRSLFAPVCRDYHVPLANGRGSTDLNSRASMMRRFAEREAQGKQCVLLYAGDFDPAGLRISDFLRSNMADLAGAIGWAPDNLIVDRFGLNFDFIEVQGLTWIDNLETGSGGRLDDPRHEDHNKEYVQSYLRKYGVRKVEANALVVRPEAGRKLCRDAILQYVDQGRISEFEEAVQVEQAALQSEIARLVTERMGGAI